MKKMKKCNNYPSLFLPEQRENEDYDSREKSPQHSKRTKNKYGLKRLGETKARKTKKA